MNAQAPADLAPSGVSKAPPFLLGAALLFWGWQTGFPVIGALLAAALEAPRWVKARWDFSDQDFTRIWVFCTLLFLGAALYAFTSNEGPADLRGLFQGATYFAQRNAGAATSRTAASLLRWVPMIFFPFIAVQAYSAREAIPLRTLSLILSARWKKARELGLAVPIDRSVSIAYPYFALCLLSASFHPNDNTGYFWGLCALVAYGLWPHRSRRFGAPSWALVVCAAVFLGYWGQHGIAHLQGYLGSLNPQWLGNFSRNRFDPTQNRTELGSIGRLKKSGRVVIRLETRRGVAPPLLREATYRIYKGRTWFADISENDFQKVSAAATNENTYVLVDDKTNNSVVNISCYLPGGKALLPLPSGCGRLENLMAYILQKSTLGAVLEEGPGLVVFNALFGPGPTMDESPNTALDLSVPGREMPALDEVVDSLQLRGKSADQAVRLLNRFFAENFTYDTWQNSAPFSRTNETPLSRFLLQTRRGHCEFFATAGVLLLRRAGVPARYVVGWSVHEGDGGKYVIRQRDAHAWCLVWDANAGGWHDCDFTPSSWAHTEEANAPPWQFLADAWSRFVFEFSKFRWGQSNLRQYVLWALVPILGLLLYQIIFRKRGRRVAAAAKVVEPVNWPGLDSEFYQLEQQLTRRGFRREPSQPLSIWLEQAVRSPELLELRPELFALLQLHYRYRFDPQGLDAEEREALRRTVGVCLSRVTSPTAV